jgi:hypothetical protein
MILQLTLDELGPKACDVLNEIGYKSQYNFYDEP